MQQALQILCLGLSQVQTIEFFPEQLVIAGWTGRNRQAIDHHIEELAALGVPRPSTVPLYYRVSVSNLTQSGTIQVVGNNTSGEVEPVLMMIKDELWLTVGSDHTDRSAETYSVALSKQLCAKVIADQAWRYSEVADHIDQISLKSWIIETTTEGYRAQDRIPYQDGVLGAIRPLADLVSGYGSTPRHGFVMSCGTVGAIGGIRSAKQFVMQLSDPVLNRAIDYRYDIQCLPVIS